METEESSHTKTEGFLEAMVQTINFQLQQESLQFGFVSTKHKNYWIQFCKHWALKAIGLAPRVF